MKKNLLTLIFCVRIIADCISQEVPTFVKTDNPFVMQYASDADQNGFIYIREDVNVLPGFYASHFRELTGLSSSDALMLKKSDSSTDGIVHNEYVQHFNGMPVEGTSLFEHVKDGRVVMINGTLIEGLDPSLSGTQMSEDMALQNALNAVPAATYAWQDSEMEAALKGNLEDSTLTYFPKGKLLIGLVGNLEPVASNCRPVWSFDITAKTPRFSVQIYVDAQTGLILRNQSNNHKNGPSPTYYNGTQTLDTRWFGGLFHGHHHLQADNEGRHIKTSYWGESHYLGIAADNDDNWSDPALGQAHYSVTRAWDYFTTMHGRVGADNHGSAVIVKTNDPDVPCNAWAIKGSSQIGFGTCPLAFPFTSVNSGDYSSVDVGAHEFTHLVIFNEANLNSSGESGALNESFCDIFASQVDGDWTHGEDVPGGTNRDLSFPNNLGHPSTYITDPLWDPAGAIHTNCGVQNHWFYLLSAGGSQNGITVEAIGNGDAAKIAYYSLCNILASSANYTQARSASIAAARLLFGSCSFQVTQVKNAWAAVGVGLPGNFCPKILGPGTICREQLPITLIASPWPLQPGLLYSWAWPSNVTAFMGQNSLKIVSATSYPITFTVTLQDNDGHRIGKTIRIENCMEVSPSDERDMTNYFAYLQPNPAQTEFNILSSESIESGLVEVFDMTGSRVITSKINSQSERVEIAHLNSGMYLVLLKTNDFSQTFKLIKQ